MMLIPIVLTPRKRGTLRIWLAWYHGIAGLAGILIVVYAWVLLIDNVSTGFRLVADALFSGMIALFLAVGVAGVLIQERAAWGTRLAAGLQVLQIPVFVIGPYKWDFFAGGYVVPYWERGFGWMLGLKAKIDIGWAGPTGSTLLGINLFPMLVLWLLLVRLPANESHPEEEPQSADLQSAASAARSHAVDAPSPHSVDGTQQEPAEIRVAPHE